jgi:hypothetical protein
VTSGVLSWRLTDLAAPGGDVVEVALGLETAKLRCGPFAFDFAKSCTPSGGVLLTLRRDGAPRLVEPADPLDHNEQIVPGAPEDLPAEERRWFEARYLAVLGRGLFDDVAHLVRLEMEFQ